MALQAAVAEVGPVSVSINASLLSFHHYKEGAVNIHTDIQYNQSDHWEIYGTANQITGTYTTAIKISKNVGGFNIERCYYY